MSADYIKWLDIISQIKDIELLQQKVIKLNNPAFAYFFALEYNYKLHLMQLIVLESNNPQYAFEFAKNIDNADINALQSVVIESKKIKYITSFACSIPKANIKLLEALILQNGDSKYIFLYLKNKNCDIKRFKDIILKFKEPKYLFLLSLQLTDLNDLNDLKEIENILIETKSITYITKFAAKIKSADIDILEQFVLDNGTEEEIRKFASVVKKSKMHNFLLI